MKTIFILTTPTSATTSIIRITNTILDGRLNYRRYYDEALKDLTPEETKKVVPPKEGHCLLHNVPPRFNTEMNLSDYRFIVNYRDPRDRICNEYYWQFSHPKPGETEEDTAKRIGRVREMGIDNWVLDRIRSPGTLTYYDNVFYVLENSNDYVVATYAQLCCGFDGFIKRISDFTGAPLTDKIMAALEPERPENIESHPQWIGGQWAGSDTMPGRYKRELMPATVEKINRYFDPLLRKMAKYDPEFAHQYLEGVPPLNASGDGQAGEPTDPGKVEIRIGDISIKADVTVDEAQLARLIKAAREAAR